MYWKESSPSPLKTGGPTFLGSGILWSNILPLGFEQNQLVGIKINLLNTRIECAWLLLQNWSLNPRIQSPWRPSSNPSSPEPSPPQTGSWPFSRAAWPGPRLSPRGAPWGLCALKPWRGKRTLLYLSCTHSHTPTRLTPDVGLITSASFPTSCGQQLRFLWHLWLDLFYWYRVDLQCCVNFCCCTGKWFSYTHTYIYSFIFFPVMIYYRILNIVPCAIQEDLVVYPAYM